jgi:hypothetical protein
MPGGVFFETDWFRYDNRVTSHVIEHITDFCHLIPSLIFLQEIVALLRRVKLKVDFWFYLFLTLFNFFFYESLFIEANIKSSQCSFGNI